MKEIKRYWKQIVGTLVAVLVVAVGVKLLLQMK